MLASLARWWWPEQPKQETWEQHQFDLIESQKAYERVDYSDKAGRQLCLYNWGQLHKSASAFLDTLGNVGPDDSRRKFLTIQSAEIQKETEANKQHYPAAEHPPLTQQSTKQKKKKIKKTKNTKPEKPVKNLTLDEALQLTEGASVTKAKLPKPLAVIAEEQQKEEKEIKTEKQQIKAPDSEVTVSVSSTIASPSVQTPLFRPSEQKKLAFPTESQKKNIEPFQVITPAPKKTKQCCTCGIGKPFTLWKKTKPQLKVDDDDFLARLLPNDPPSRTKSRDR